MESEQVVQPPRVALVQTKDPKKQEAGRKGAEARRKKLESLKAELSAANERVHMDYMAELSEHTVAQDSAEEHKPENRATGSNQRSLTSKEWLVGIGLALIAGVVYISSYKNTTKPPAPTLVSNKPLTNAPTRGVFHMD